MDEGWGVGKEAESKAFDHSRMDNGRPFEIIWGEFPHGRQDNRMYARFEDGRIEDFDGHRILTKVELRTFNYLKCSGLSGNEVRKGGQYRIYFNDRLVWAKFCREATRGLRDAASTIDKLLDCSISLWRPEEPEIGRLVFWRDQPAIVRSFFCDEDEGSGNRIVLEADGPDFRPPCYLDKGEDWDGKRSVVTNILDDGIWWWRERDNSRPPDG